MKVYLAAQFKQRDELREYAKQLRAAGVEVTSRWLRERGDLEQDLDPLKSYRKNAEIDLEDIDACDTFVLFTVEPTTWIKRGGKHFEAGYAFAKAKQMVVIGPPENIFYYLDDKMLYFPTFQKFLGGYVDGRP